MNFEKQFKLEISNYSDDELIDIINGSLDFYSDDEINTIKEELQSRNISSNILDKLNSNADEFVMNRQKKEIKQQTQSEKEERAEREKQNRINLSVLKNSGAEGYWEYEVIDVIDKFGSINPSELKDKLNDLGVQGWHLKCAYSNELGKDALSFMGFSANTTVDQHILILERFVAFEKQ